MTNAVKLKAKALNILFDEHLENGGDMYLSDFATQYPWATQAVVEKVKEMAYD